MNSSRSSISWQLASVSLLLRTAVLAFVVAALCYLSARLVGALVISIPQRVWPLWPGCALLVAILLLVPRKKWPILLPAGLAGFVLSDLQSGVSIHDIAWLILADIVEILVAVWGVSYALNGLPRLNSLKALVKYSFFTVFLASLAVASIINGLSGDAWRNWRFSLLSEALAFLTVTPAILGLFDPGRPSLRASRVYYLEAATLIAALISLSYFMFIAPGRNAPPALLYSLVPFLIWSALRFGSTGVGISASIVALTSIWGAVHGRGPFIETNPVDRVLFLQLFLFFTSLPFMVLAVLVEERKCAQDELRKSADRLRWAMLSGKAVGWDWELKTGRDSWFGDLKTMFGLPFETYVGHPEDFHRYVHPEDRQRVAKTLARARTDHEAYVEEFRVVWPNGTQRWVAASGRFYYSRKGEPTRMLGMSVDITDRKRAEEAVKQSEEKYRRIVETTNEGVWVLDSNLHTSFVNQQMAGMLGYQPGEMVGRSVLDFCFPEDVERKQHVLAGRRDGLSEHFDDRFRRKDGAELWVRMAAITICKEDGTFDGAMAMASDITERRRAEEALRESEARFRLVANTAPVMIWMSGEDKLCTYFNTPWLEFTGRPIESELRNGWAEGVHADDIKACLETYTRAFDRKVKFNMEYRLRRHDGKYRWVFDIGVPRFNQDGSFAGYIGSCLDVTDRKVAKEALEKSEEKFSKAFRQTPMALALTSATDRRYIDVNESFERFSGWHREELIGRTPSDIQLWVNPMAEEEVARHVQNEGGLRLFENRFRMRNGTIRTALIGAELIELNGEPCVLVVGMDISEQKLAEEALRESENRLRLLLDSTAEAIYGIDLEGRCTFCNPACLRALGYDDADALLGKNMHDLIHHSHSDRTFFPEDECSILKTLRTGEEVHLDDEVFWRANGTSFPAEYWSHPQRSGQEIVGAVIAFIDVTERKAAEAALASVSRRLIEAQEQERSRIARELHDDIGQRLALLTVQLGEFWQSDPDLPVAVRDRIGQFQKQSAGIATDVQSLSHKLHSSKLEYLGVATAMRAFCSELSAQQNVEIVFAHDDVPRTLPNEISLCLFRVLQEALQNAIKHSGARHVDVELRYASDAIELTVRDSGSGFDTEQTMQSQGLGLISMAERLKLVNGELSIDSQPKRGTAIHARVPISKVLRASV